MKAGHFSGAYYLGGYAIELALKACIASSFQPGAIPDKRFVEKIYTHDLTQLIGLAQLQADRRIRAASDSIFAQNWENVAEWSETARYRITGEHGARLLMSALLDPDHGVFEWIKSRW